MKTQRDTYRKNYILVFAFGAVLTVSLVVAISLASTLITSKVEADFSTRKGEVVDHSLSAFNEFFQTKIPEISLYQGYLDSTTAATFADTVLRTYPFVDRILFYDVLLNNDISTQYGFSASNLVIYPTVIYEFSLLGNDLHNGSLHHNSLQDTVDPKGFVQRKIKHSSFVLDDFNTMAFKFSSFLERADTSRVIYADEEFRVFYSVNPGKISYMNMPRNDDLKIYKELMDDYISHYTSYDQDMFTFFVDPNKIGLNNVVPELYEHIEIQPLVFDNVNIRMDELVTEVALPGALADYKLFFKSSKTFLSSEINKRLYPVIGGILLIYLFLIMFAYLIYRNLYINKRMFKLQYDFVNNLTHEFKTPVSVIKIAGNNIGNSKGLSDKERMLYSKILDEEADKLNNLMNTLLSFTQLENKSIKLRREYINLDEFCNRVQEATSLKYQDLELDCTVDVNMEFYTDPVMLNSVFQNLIDNAYKYSRPDNRYLKIHIFKRKRSVVMTFSDRGIGIAKSELEHVFKKFYRVKSQYNQQGSAGLGLAFCKELVNFMGGTIVAESQLGQGTTFTIYLPID